MKNQSKAKPKTNNPTPKIQKTDFLSPCTNMPNLFDSKTECWKCGSSGSRSCSTTASGMSEADVYWLNGENSTYFVYFIACFYRNRRVFVYTKRALSFALAAALSVGIPFLLQWQHNLQVKTCKVCLVSLWGGINSTVESWSKINLTVIGNITWVSWYGAFGNLQG